MKIIRIASVVCLLISVKFAAGQELSDVPAEPMYESIMEIRPENNYATPTEPVEVAQAPAPATVLAPPIVRGNAFATEQLLPTPQTVTPDMWYYSQEIQRHDDPAQAVRRKAELRAAQRMQRIAAMKWFGFSNSRPQASPVPMMGMYSPVWIGNGYDRYDWAGVNWAAAPVIRVENYEYR
ncbi:MAG TPA: hypothetical protein VFV87_09015 [Pirellulaceae bacterium]|nr:hypothetical protein [Pirellulaceae bacterium]